MTEQQKLEPIKESCKICGGTGSYYERHEVGSGYGFEIVACECTLSPIPHQDGASAEDVLKPMRMSLIGVNGSKNFVDYDDALSAMHQFARSETASLRSELDRVVAEKDREIAELRQQYHTVERHRLEDAASAIADQGFQYDRIKKLQSDLSASNANRTRLIESVKKWGGAWRTCRAELKEAKERVKELEGSIIKFANEIKTK